MYCRETSYGVNPGVIIVLKGIVDVRLFNPIFILHYFKLFMPKLPCHSLLAFIKKNLVILEIANIVIQITCQVFGNLSFKSTFL